MQQLPGHHMAGAELMHWQVQQPTARALQWQAYVLCTSSARHAPGKQSATHDDPASMVAPPVGVHAAGHCALLASPRAAGGPLQPAPASHVVKQTHHRGWKAGPIFAVSYEAARVQDMRNAGPQMMPGLHCRLMLSCDAAGTLSTRFRCSSN